MKDDEKVELKVGDIKRAAGKCETAKEILKELFPDVFKVPPPEWEAVTDECSFEADTAGGPFMVCRGQKFGFLDPGGGCYMRYYKGIKYEYEIREGEIWRKKR